ncbi:hypothetical protein I7I50_04879 [Histoplasma capsulatum G186AR]|uniref:Uncharacterized protein n=1 Tax=Ajellomyces capsulatus TaxID=5037 RepID=A0A8H7ZBH1_AJECA|nr:hypothetical protein I7I52_03137 [Histoplasma capsulatum]QSS75669.1 hypothetical protein I7I50_04879 [Histoplasma capsulatum G186AR]
MRSHPPLAPTFRVKSHPSCASICPHKDRLKLHSKPGSFVTIRCCYRLKIRQSGCDDHFLLDFRASLSENLRLADHAINFRFQLVGPALLWGCFVLARVFFVGVGRMQEPKKGSLLVFLHFRKRRNPRRLGVLDLSVSALGKPDW